MNSNPGRRVQETRQEYEWSVHHRPHVTLYAVRRLAGTRRRSRARRQRLHVQRAHLLPQFVNTIRRVHAQPSRELLALALAMRVRPAGCSRRGRAPTFTTEVADGPLHREVRRTIPGCVLVHLRGVPHAGERHRGYYRHAHWHRRQTHCRGPHEGDRGGHRGRPLPIAHHGTHAVRDFR